MCSLNRCRYCGVPIVDDGPDVCEPCAWQVLARADIEDKTPD